MIYFFPNKVPIQPMDCNVTSSVVVRDSDFKNGVYLCCFNWKAVAHIVVFIIFVNDY